jgi:hypothetical protein
MRHFSTRSRSTHRSRWGARGFSLVEVIVASSVMMMLMLGVLRFKVDMAKSMYVSEEKGKINHDIRIITQEMATVARDASFFQLYSTYAMADRDTPADELAQSNAGDFLVLVFYGDPPDPIRFNVRPVSRIVGYYRSPIQAGDQQPGAAAADAAYEPVRKFDISVANGKVPANTYLSATYLPAGGTFKTLEQLLPAADAATIATHKVITPFAQGLDNGKLFYNFWDKSIMVNGKIVHGNDAKRVTDTYNFTITPRS